MNPQIALQENISDIQALSEGDVHIWEIALDDPAPKTRDLLGEVLSGDEKSRASRLHTGVYRNRFIMARGYMRIILGLYLDTSPGEIRFEYNRHGKPVIPAELNPKNISFNLSHSRNLALCAVTFNGEIGIDVEYPRHVLRAEKILERFFSQGEREYYRSQQETLKESAFMSLWTTKEAYSKAVGRGLSSDLRDIDLSPALSGRASVRLDNGQGEIWTIHRFHPGDGYTAALALKGEASAIGRYSAGPRLP